MAVAAVGLWRVDITVLVEKPWMKASLDHQLNRLQEDHEFEVASDKERHGRTCSAIDYVLESESQAAVEAAGNAFVDAVRWIDGCKVQS